MDFVRPIEALIPGVQGRILAVLAETTADLNLRTIARLSDTSVAQASRVLPDLVSLGLVDRREAPPSALFRLVREHVAVDALLLVARARDRMMERMKTMTAQLPVAPLSVIVFGSFARGEADEKSDIDVLLVRPADVDESDERWSASVQLWRDSVGQMSGNRVEVLEVPAAGVASRLESRQQVWRDIKTEGLAVYGLSLEELVQTGDG
jgi:predicted nucleotidyltransferase